MSCHHEGASVAVHMTLRALRAERKLQRIRELCTTAALLPPHEPQPRYLVRGAAILDVLSEEP